MTEEQREEFLKVSREGLKEFGACNGFYEDDSGCCCAVGSYRKKKFGNAYSPDDNFEGYYIAGVIHGFDGFDIGAYSFQKTETFKAGYEDGKKLREEFIIVQKTQPE